MFKDNLKILKARGEMHCTGTLFLLKFKKKKVLVTLPFTIHL